MQENDGFHPFMRVPFRIWWGSFSRILAGLCLLCGLSLVQGRGQSLIPTDLPVTATSRSGQFWVHGRTTSLPAPSLTLNRIGTNSTINLRPDLLVVTAERVKLAVERRLSAQDPWRSRVHLQLRDANQVTGPISIRAQCFQDGWQFYIPLPERLEWERLVRAFVEVVLLERANRLNTTADCALVPLWMTEGLSQLILAEEGRDLVAEYATILVRSELRRDPLDQVRSGLQNRDLLSFSELGLFTLDPLADRDRFQEFQASSTLLTWEFLKNDEGRRLLRNFLQQLPGCLNWQTALLRSSGGRFLTLLDIEKWWAMSAADTLAADALHRVAPLSDATGKGKRVPVKPSSDRWFGWPRDRVLQRLDDLRVEITNVRPDTNSPAVPQRVPLTEVLVRWDFELQKEILNRKISQWRVLALRSPQDLASLCLGYVQVATEYLNGRERAGLGTTARGSLETRSSFLAATAARKVGDLDRQLEAIQAGGASPNGRREPAISKAN